LRKERDALRSGCCYLLTSAIWQPLFPVPITFIKWSKEMNELVFTSNGKDVTTSLLVAEVFGRAHKSVLRDIERLSCSEQFNRHNFVPITYTDSRGREQKAYEMTKDGFSFLVMGYTGAKASEFKERFINEFNKRELMLKDDDYILARSQEILQKRIALAENRIAQLEVESRQQQAQIESKDETINLQKGELEKAAPKVSYYDDVLQSTNTMTFYRLEFRRKEWKQTL